MSDYCVIIRGRLRDERGERDDASLWAPIASSLRLDEATFATRVLAALPLIVRRGLDQVAAARLVDNLEQAGVDACTVPDDAQLAYLEREGSTRGPVPLSALAQFIQPDERYRLRDTQEWKTWPSAQAGNAELLHKPSAEAESTAAESAQPTEDDTRMTSTSDDDEARSPPVATGGDEEMPDSTAASADPSAASVLPALPSGSAGTPSLLMPENDDSTDNPAAGVALADGTPAEPGPTKRLLLPVGRTGLSIAAGYLGLLAVIPFIAPLTLIVSILAWRDLRRRPGMHGSGRVLFGLIMGVGMTVLLVIGVAIGFSSSKQIDVGLKAPATTTTPASTSTDHS